MMMRSTCKSSGEVALPSIKRRLCEGVAWERFAQGWLASSGYQIDFRPRYAAYVPKTRDDHGDDFSTEFCLAVKRPYEVPRSGAPAISRTAALPSTQTNGFDGYPDQFNRLSA
jgi:hypothetical protein